MNERVLLHVCCAPCSTHAIAVLKEGADVTLFFSNSNIFPYEEYSRRLHELKRIAKELDVKMIEDKYDHNAWLQFVKGLEGEPERGKRCLKCFEFNLIRTGAYAKRNGFDYFTTTLTISPHKNAEDIFRIGKDLGNFLAIDFKKNEGFKHSVEMSKKLGLYRQNYCGCEFSRR